MEAYAYSRMNLIDKALAAIDTCISLAPNEANPYDSRGDILAEHGRFEEAGAAYLQAIRIKPDFTASQLKLGFLYNQLGDYTKADYYFNRMAAIAGDTMHAGAGFYNSYVPLRQGKFNEAIRILDKMMAENTCSDSSLGISAARRLKSYILAYTGRCAPAVAEVDKYIEPAMAAVKWNSRMRMEAMMAVTVCAKCGEYNRAEQIAEKLKAMAHTDFPIEAYYEFAKGAIELEKGNVDSAIAYLEPAVSGKTFSFSEHFMLAQAYMTAKRYRDAAAEYESIISMFSENQSFLAIWSVKSYYKLGLAYEKLGQPDKAIERYEKFLDIWKNADPGIEEIADARNRLAHLKNSS
jgi:tetratricopeptide (TPR) repeat protein